jgi:hypothetical protein
MKTQLLAVGLAFLFAPAAMAQTADELAKGSTNTSNVVNYGWATTSTASARSRRSTRTM